MLSQAKLLLSSEPYARVRDKVPPNFDWLVSRLVSLVVELRGPTAVEVICPCIRGVKAVQFGVPSMNFFLSRLCPGVCPPINYLPLPIYRSKSNLIMSLPGNASESRSREQLPVDPALEHEAVGDAGDRPRNYIST
jgi:hypothetical protein